MHYQQGGGKYIIHVSIFLGGVLHQGKKNWEKCICSGELAFMHLGALFQLNFISALLPLVSSPFASP
jgi:hypothetical protein